jgi:tRNA(Leu) C34 or U34 (ribose-2'-O)-methylase TrmL
MPPPHPAELPERHVVLVAPEIHWNTGNIGRTCLAANASLHLIRPLGFSLDSKEVRRAGLDYWDEVSGNRDVFKYLIKNFTVTFHSEISSIRPIEW